METYYPHTELLGYWCLTRGNMGSPVLCPLGSATNITVYEDSEFKYHCLYFSDLKSSPIISDSKACRSESDL